MQFMSLKLNLNKSYHLLTGFCYTLNTELNTFKCKFLIKIVNTFKHQSILKIGCLSYEIHCQWYNYISAPMKVETYEQTRYVYTYTVFLVYYKP